MPDVLLIQIREPGQGMERHERDCVARRLGTRSVQIHTRNVFAQRPEPSWLVGADAVIIGGSGSFSVQDPRSEPWVGSLRALVEACFKRSIPGLGICFGHQLIGLHLGADVITDEQRRESGTVAFDLTDHGVTDPVMGQFNPRFHGQTGHTDLVVGVPKGATLLAQTDIVDTQSFKVDGVPWWTTQFHPDLVAAEANERYRAFEAALAKEQGRPADIDRQIFDERGDQSAPLIGRWFDHVLGPTPA